MKNLRVAVCGAGIAGIATAFYLSKKHGIEQVFLIDKNLPMSLTTSKSGENFRDYWPQESLGQLVRRSIELMEQLADSSSNFALRYSGYEFVSRSQGYDIFGAQSSSLQRIANHEAIRSTRSYLAPDIKQVVRIEQAGDFDVHALGTLMLGKSRIDPIQAEIVNLTYTGKDYSLTLCRPNNERELRADKVVLAAGPFVNNLASMLDIQLPVQCFLQQKVVIPDPLGIVPRDMPFTILADSQELNWTSQERDAMKGDPQYKWLLEEFPSGLHIKPESSGQIKLGWAFNRTPENPVWAPSWNRDFPNIVLRGATRVIPDLAKYLDEMPTPVIGYAGYYSRTEENWPLIGPLGTPNSFTVSALSGFGTMAACAAGELCADWVVDAELPTYAKFFNPARYQDPELLELIRCAASDGQL